MDLIRSTLALRKELRTLRFAAPVTHVYNPLVYAWRPHRAYLARYGATQREIVLLGMNPGPFGMAQTGVPFGDVTMVRDWLRIAGSVGRPQHEHPRRPVAGFGCHRGEVSGRRLWGWARDAYGSPERFFARFFVLNYCPLAFLEESGRNRTPDRLPVAERDELFRACDKALRRAIAYLRPLYVIGVGRFAAARARSALDAQRVEVGSMPHPSPASPAANRGWHALATAALSEIGIRMP